MVSVCQNHDNPILGWDTKTILAMSFFQENKGEVVYNQRSYPINLKI